MLENWHTRLSIDDGRFFYHYFLNLDGVFNPKLDKRVYYVQLDGILEDETLGLFLLKVAFPEDKTTDGSIFKEPKTVFDLGITIIHADAL